MLHFCRCVRKSAQPHGKPQQQVSRKFNLNMQNFALAKLTPTPLPYLQQQQTGGCNSVSLYTRYGMCVYGTYV